MSARAELTALMIAPDRGLAEAFARTQPESRAFQILADLRVYPPRPTLEMRLRQLAPDVVLLDLSSDFEAAGELIRAVAAFRPPVHVVGLHPRNDSEVILRSLRLGASEFLCAPFEAGVQQEAVARIRRLSAPAPAQRELGKIVAFASAKPGSGASMLASQTAFALTRLTGARVLLADFDLMGGTLSFYLKLNPSGSLVEALGESDRLATASWAALLSRVHGLDVLPAPAVPASDPVEPARLHNLCEYTRQVYAWAILDLPAIFHRTSLLGFSESDRAFLISTQELSSLHLARKAVKMLAQLGFSRERFQVLLNRASKGDGLRGSDMEKILASPVDSRFPNDYFALDRVVTLGQPLGPDCELGRALEEFATRLSGSPRNEKKNGVLMSAVPAFSQT